MLMPTKEIHRLIDYIIKLTLITLWLAWIRFVQSTGGDGKIRSSKPCAIPCSRTRNKARWRTRPCMQFRGWSWKAAHPFCVLKISAKKDIFKSWRKCFFAVAMSKFASIWPWTKSFRISWITTTARSPRWFARSMAILLWRRKKIPVLQDLRDAL